MNFLPFAPPSSDQQQLLLQNILANRVANEANNQFSLINSNTKMNGNRVCYTPFQLELLNGIFLKIKYPNCVQKDQIAHRVGITRDQVKIWFQNRRRKDQLVAQGRLDAKKVVPGILSDPNRIPSNNEPIVNAVIEELLQAKDAPAKAPAVRRNTQMKNRILPQLFNGNSGTPFSFPTMIPQTDTHSSMATCNAMNMLKNNQQSTNNLSNFMQNNNNNNPTNISPPNNPMMFVELMQKLLHNQNNQIYNNHFPNTIQTENDKLNNMNKTEENNTNDSLRHEKGSFGFNIHQIADVKSPHTCDDRTVINTNPENYYTPSPIQMKKEETTPVKWNDDENKENRKRKFSSTEDMSVMNNIDNTKFEYEQPTKMFKTSPSDKSSGLETSLTSTGSPLQTSGNSGSFEQDQDSGYLLPQSNETYEQFNNNIMNQFNQSQMPITTTTTSNNFQYFNQLEFMNNFNYNQSSNLSTSIQNNEIPDKVAFEVKEETKDEEPTQNIYGNWFKIPDSHKFIN
ncbi:hypothetical protein SNEBB_006924 [Seison nebaliae]|nr:hypothetical protein SNEBB_006924 [Seison nebaliae]